MDFIIRNSFLSGVIASPRGGSLDNDNRFRRYRTSVRTTATIGGNDDSRTTSIFYEVGRAVNTKGRALNRPSDGALCIEAAYPTNTVLAEDFIGLAKKYTNFSASFEYSSLAGVAERLARALAASSVFTDVDSNDIRGGAGLVVNAVGTYDGPISSLTNTVYIPRLVNSSITGEVFSVLANAVSGEGSSVATDIIELDAGTRQPLIPEVDPAGLAAACVDALRIVGSNMIASDQGPLFSLAVTRGIHRVLSVVGHTDEGGITRDLLRCSSFAPPFGGIHYALEPYAGLPALQFTAFPAYAAYVDSIALTTAAVVAHADPGVMYGGSWFPTFYNGTADSDGTVRPGQNQAGTAAMANRNRAQLLGSAPAFFSEYIRGLATIFGASGDSSLACRFMGAASYALPQDPRHLRYATVSPWFWIEPTGLLPHDFLGSKAEANGAGSFAWKDTTRTRVAWDELTQHGEADTTFSAYVARFRSPRQQWFFAHWMNHPLNGLGAIRVRQLDPNGIVQPGQCVAHPDVRDRVEADLPFTDYLWTRGQSPPPAPGELLNLSGSVGFLVRHLTYDDDGVPHEEHVPTRREFLDTTVTIEVGRPVGIATGASNAGDNHVRRARTKAANELAAARRRAAVFGRADVAEMPILTSAPALAPPPSAGLERGSDPGGSGSQRRAVPAGLPGNDTWAREPTGAPRNPVPHHQPLRAPQLARQAGGLGGGAAPIPPPPPGVPAPPALPPADDDNAPPAPVATAPPVADPQAMVGDQI
ncbi:coat protein [Tolypocladium cylindrosporum virus 1]|uniref:Coat protein n=1 Tax=Tolypocladium cylindrosporum virus 1 TaxID=939923 RepID=E7BBP6_9VIRU|nr:coat protein [Tolypocladium cylindrosporum virus 1]CBY84991.1 coat protein [Tolypocladium cylindrosporum virus 1]